MGTQIHFQFNREKAIETLLYIANRIESPDIYTLMKIAYFADKEHLYRYGRFIFGDRYIAMNYGPVPSGAFTICKEAQTFTAESIGFKAGSRSIKPFRDAKQELFSKSDITCLNEAISRYGSMEFDQLLTANHDATYIRTPRNSPISIEDIAAQCDESVDLIEHLRERHSA